MAERMENVDAKLLQLQNVTSEVQHIQKEIDRCLDFSAGDEELELVPFEQFHTEASEILANETADNEHEQYLARLKFENEQRREFVRFSIKISLKSFFRLLSTLNELEGRRNVLQSDIRGKEVRLQGLKPKLEDLTKVAEPVFEMVGAKFKDLSIEGEQRKLSLQLPAPLAVAHIHAAAYKEIHDGEYSKILRNFLYKCAVLDIISLRFLKAKYCRKSGILQRFRAKTVRTRYKISGNISQKSENFSK